MAKTFFIAGLVLLAIAALIHYTPWILNWIGRLPGDIRLESGRGRIYIPLMSMLIISIILTILLNIYRR